LRTISAGTETQHLALLCAEATVARGCVPDRLGDAHAHELPVDEHRAPLEQEGQADLGHADRHRLTFTASAISLIVAPIPFDCVRMCAGSSSVGSTSSVRIMATPTVTMAHTAPNQKTTHTQVGTDPSPAPERTF
jgi:hypothetical protein